MRDHGGVIGALSHLNRRKGLGQGTNLIDLDQNRISNPFINPFFENTGVGHKEIITNQLDLLS